jgi:hypothetical protein
MTRAEDEDSQTRTLPPDVWGQVLNHLTLLELASPLASTCKLFFRTAQERLFARSTSAASTYLQHKFELSSRYVLPRVDGKRGELLYVINIESAPAHGHALEVYDIATGVRRARCAVPAQLAQWTPEEVISSPDGQHVLVSYYKFVALFRYDETEFSLEPVRGYELDQVDRDEEQLGEELESVVSVCRFSPSGERVVIAQLQAVLDEDTRVHVTVVNDRVAAAARGPLGSGAVAQGGVPKLELCAADAVTRFLILAQYSWDALSLHGVQLNSAPPQLIIPPNRIADAGIVLADIVTPAPRIARTLDSVFDSQIVGFSPDAKTLLEAYSVSLGDHDPSTQIMLHDTAAAATDAPAAACTLPLGALSSLHFSADSASLLLLHHGGWTLMRRENGSVSGSASADEVALMCSSADGALVYGRTGKGERRAAWAVHSGQRVWEEEREAKGDGDVESDEVLVVVDGVPGFVEVSRCGDGRWRIRIFRERAFRLGGDGKEGMRSPGTAGAARGG